MTRQGDLFGSYPKEPGYVDTDTSKAAAEAVSPRVAGIRARVLRFIEQQGPSTCDQVEEALALRHQTASARVRELFLMGRLKDTGDRRRTRSGHYAILWQAQNENQPRESTDG